MCYINKVKEIEALAEDIRKHQCILFAGSGLSAQATDPQGNRPPTWEQLLKKIIHWCETHDISMEGIKSDLFATIEKGRFLIVAQELKERLGDHLGRCFRELLGRSNIMPSQAHKLAVSIGWKAILTSNYDKLLETAYTNLHRVSPRVLGPTDTAHDALDLLREPSMFIFKIHGDVDRPETMVFGSYDYTKLLYGREDYRHFIDILFATNTILFIGYGGNDPNLAAIYDKLSALYKRDLREHYLLTSTNTFTPFERKRLRQDQGLHCLCYKENPNHQGVVGFLELLLKKINAPALSLSSSKQATIPTLTKQASYAEELWILAVTGMSLLRDHRQFFEEKWPGMRIRIILADPNGQGLCLWGRQFPGRDVSGESRAVTEYFLNFNGLPRKKGSLPPLEVSIRYCDLPRFAMAIADPDKVDAGSVVIATQSYARESEDRHYDFIKSSEKPNEFNRTVALFRKEWENAVVVTSSTPVLDVLTLKEGDTLNLKLGPFVNHAINYEVEGRLDNTVLSIDMIWIRELFGFLGQKGTVIHPSTLINHWPKCQEKGDDLIYRSDVEEGVLWPIIYSDSTSKKTISRIPLKALRDIIQFRPGEETGLMRYPEIVALIDGVCFRYPSPVFIRDFVSILKGESQKFGLKQYLVDDAPTRWRGLACKLCGSTCVKVQHVIGPSRVVKCVSCGLEYNNPQAIIPRSALDKYGSKDEIRYNQMPVMRRANANAKIVVERLKKLKSDLFGELLLDVGCASGEFLHLLQKNYNWPAETLKGLEPSHLSTEHARSNYNLNVTECTAEEADFTVDQYSVIVLLNTMEHLPEPRTALLRFHKWLKPNGMLVIGNVPNAKGLAPSLEPAMFIDKNFPDGQHHFHYTPATLTKLCESVGFQVVSEDGRLQDIVGSNVAETAAWIAHSCGVPIEECIEEHKMLRALRDRLEAESWEDATRLSIPPLKESDSLIAFWRDSIWSNPRLSEAFWLWLSPDPS